MDAEFAIPRHFIATRLSYRSAMLRTLTHNIQQQQKCFFDVSAEEPFAQS
jgi:hypothetical protein